MFQKIGNRVFFYVLVPMIGIITIIFIFQFYFLDDWYYTKKVQGLEKSILELTNELETIHAIDTEKYEYRLYPLVEQFKERNSASVEYHINYHDENIDSAEEEEEKILTIELDNEIPSYLYMNLHEWDYKKIKHIFTRGNQVDVEGFINEDYFYPVKIEDSIHVDVHEVYKDYYGDTNDGEAESIGISDQYEKVQRILIEDMYKELEFYKGVITIIDIEENDTVDYGYSDEYFEENEAVVIEEGFRYVVVEEPFSNISNLVFEKKLNLTNGITGTIYIKATMQGISEVIGYLVPFYWAIYIIGVIVAVFASKILSRRITKPILTITNRTKKMSQMDFEEKIEEESNDELGELSRSINTLSDNLEHALSDLNTANKELLKDIEKERQLESKRKEFIANVSHELKTPLGIAKGYIEAVMDGIRKDKQEDYLKIALKEIDQINQIVLNMIDLMKLESNKQPLVFKMKEIEPYFAEMKQYFEMLLATKQMVIKLPDHIEQSYIETKTFKTLLVNLFSNAIHYGKNGTTIHVTTKKSKYQQVITIENVVMDAEDIDLDKIWHKFYTVDESKNRMTSGTGLGLSIVKSILEQYESRYNVYLDNDIFIFEFTLKSHVEDVNIL